MKNFLNFILIILITYSHSSIANIIQTSDVKDIEKTFESINHNTLVIFDVDNVLVVPKDKIFQPQNGNYLKELNLELEHSVDKVNLDFLYSIIFTQHQSNYVDFKIKDIISELQSKGIKVLALTNLFTGNFGSIKSMEDWRYSELKIKGYNFNLSWPTLKSKVFNEFETAEKKLVDKNKLYPTYKNGIIFTNNTLKGPSLSAFLKYANFVPEKIIFIDDKIENLESVREITMKLNIPFIGIEYLAAYNIPTSHLDEQRAKLQYKILKDEKKWISDSEADKMLKDLTYLKSK